MVSTRSALKKKAIRPEAGVKGRSARKRSDAGVKELENDIPAAAATTAATAATAAAEVEVEEELVLGQEKSPDKHSIASLDSPVKSRNLQQKFSEELNSAAHVVKSAQANGDKHIASQSIATLSKTPKKRQSESASSDEKQVGNELTKLIPGYVAPLKLDTSSLDRYRPSAGLSELCRRAEQTDASTAGFVVSAADTRAMKKTSNGFMPTTYAALYSSFKQGTKRAPDNSAGKGWFNMVPTPLTEDIKTDLAVIRNRNYLDPKRFYKSADNNKNKIMQLGTVIEGSAEFYSSRLTKKQRRGNLTEEIMADPAAADYTKNKYKVMQQTKSKKGRNSYKKKPSKKARRGY
jgi:hypothetical protein